MGELSKKGFGTETDHEPFISSKKNFRLDEWLSEMAAMMLNPISESTWTAFQKTFRMMDDEIVLIGVIEMMSRYGPQTEFTIKHKTVLADWASAVIPNTGILMHESTQGALRCIFHRK